MRILAAQVGCRPESPGIHASVGERPAHPGLLQLAPNRVRSPARAPGPQVFRGRSASAGVGDLLGSVVHVRTRGPRGGLESFQFPGHEPWDPVNLA